MQNLQKKMFKPAILVLEDGSFFQGVSIGADGQSTGEVVFNTAMTGYQEILTDPSYARQIVTLTYPHVGNTGTNLEDDESAQVWAAGLVIRDFPMLASNFRNEQNLSGYLLERDIVAVAEIDTRRLTRILRDNGAMRGSILAGDIVNDNPEQAREQALQAARDFPGLDGMDLAKEVSCKQPYEWTEGSWQLGTGYSGELPDPAYHVVVYDYGLKRNILRLLRDRACRVTVVPAQTPASDVLAMQPHGVLLANGPGDPRPCDYAIRAIQELLETDIPIFGICLGHQLLALASGAKSMKMKLGHHGANHPVQNLQDGSVLITSQNHGFAVDEDSLPDNVRVTHKSLFDGTVQAIERTDKPAYGFQGHPEASPGPHDNFKAFDRFIDLMESRKAGI